MLRHITWSLPNPCDLLTAVEVIIRRRRRKSRRKNERCRRAEWMCESGALDSEVWSQVTNNPGSQALPLVIQQLTPQFWKKYSED